MKKVYILSIVSILFPILNSFAQEYKWQYQNGINYNTIIPAISFDTISGRPGFQVGINRSFRLSKKFDLKSGLQFSIKRYRINYSGFPGDGFGENPYKYYFDTTSIASLYTDIPLLFECKIGKRIRINTGVEGSFLLFRKTKIQERAIPKLTNQEPHLYTQRYFYFSNFAGSSSFTLSSEIGTTYKATERLNLNFNINYSILKFNGEFPSPFDRESAHQFWIQLGTEYNFGKKNKTSSQ